MIDLIQGAATPKRVADKLNEVIEALNALDGEIESFYHGPDDDIADPWDDDEDDNAWPEEAGKALDELSVQGAIGDALDALGQLLPEDHLLLDFVRYCAEHPELRMWQALRNWSGYSTIYGSGPDEDLIDTFYLTTKGPEDPEPLETARKAFLEELDQHQTERPIAKRRGRKPR